MTEIGPIDIKLTASGISDVLNAFKSIEDRAVALERKLDSIGKQGARARAKTAKDEANEKGKSKDQELKDTEKAESAKTSATEKWAKQRERIIHNSAMMAGRLAKQQADKEISEAQRSASARMAFSRQLAGRIVSDFRSTLGHATRIFGALMALGGGLSVQNAFSNEMKISKSAMALQIASDVPGRPEQRVSAKEATEKARALGIEYATPTADVLEAQHAIVAKTGMGKKSQELLGDVMKIATAEGADPKELATAIASAMAQNPKLTNEEARNLMKMMVDQGKVGAIEVKDLAKIIPVLTKTAVLYSGNQSDNQARLVTMAQSAITTTGGPEQAAVAVSRFSDWMSSKKGSKAMAARGFNVFDKDGNLKPIDEQVAGVLTHGGNTAQGLGQMGMEGKAKSLVEAFTATYNAAIKEGKTKEQAADMALKAYREELNMRITDAKLESHLKLVQGTDAFKVSQNMEKLSQAIGLNLAPVLTDLITKIGAHAEDIGKIMKSIGEFIKWASEHPWTTIAIAGAAAFAKAVATEVAASALKNVLAQSLTASLGKGGAGLTIGTVGNVAIAAAAGVAIGLALTEALETSSKDTKKVEQEDVAKTNSLFFKIHSGDPAAIEEAKNQIKILRGKDTEKGANQTSFDQMESEFMRGEYLASFLTFVKTGFITPGGDENARKQADILQKAVDEAEKEKSVRDKQIADQQKATADKFEGAANTIDKAADKMKGKTSDTTPSPGDFGGSTGGAKTGANGNFGL